jgi:hypothetical protein
MSQSPLLVTIGPERVPLSCLVCRGQRFTGQEIKLNTSGMEFLGMGWANQSGTALICVRCGFVHTFAGKEFEVWVREPGKSP